MFAGSLVVRSRNLWTPENIGSKLMCWYDASDTATISLSGSKVTQWANKASNNYHMGQANDNLRPTYSGTLNGRNLIGVNQQTLFTSIPAGTFSAGIHVTGLIRKTGANNSFENFVARTTGSWPDPVEKYNNSLLVGSTNPTSVQEIISFDIRTATNFTLISIVVTPAIVKEYVNEVAGLNVSVTSLYKDAGTTLYLGSRTGLGTRFTGDWAEFVITMPLSDTERQKLAGSILHRWGLTANLPANHPFKNYPPRGL